MTLRSARLSHALRALVLCALAATPARAGSAQAVARVRSVVSESEIVVDRGTAEGLSPGITDLPVKPMRVPAEGRPAELEPMVLLARATVVAAGEHEARLALAHVSGPVSPGDVVFYRVEVPPAWDGDGLFATAAQDTRLLGHEDGAPFVSFGALRADTAAATRDGALARMLADIKGCGAKVKGRATMPDGPQRGRDLGDVLAGAARADLASFLEYVPEYAGTYLGRDLPLCQSFADWVWAGSPSVAREKAKRAAQAHRVQGAEAMARGDVEAAEEAFRAALAIVPDDAALQAQLDRTIAVRTRRERLARDPDDTATRWAQMIDYEAAGARTLASKELDALEKAGYDPDGCLRYRGFIAVKDGRYAEGAALLRRLAARRPEDKVLDGWVRYAEAKARLAETPDSFEAQIAVARVHEEDGSWDDAVVAYREAIRFARTPEQRERAAGGQERIALFVEAERQVQLVEGAIRSHAGGEAGAATARVGQLCQKAEDVACLTRALARIASAARAVYEGDLAVLAMKGRADLDPGNPEAWSDLADVYWGFQRWEDCRDAADRALELDPARDTARYLRAEAAVMLGDLATVASIAEARIAAGADAWWPWRERAIVAAAAGRWADAEAAAAEGLRRNPEGDVAQRTYAAAALGRLGAAETAAGRDVPRQRLRLVRALVKLNLFREAEREAAALAATPYHPDAQAALADVDYGLRDDAALLASLEAAGVHTPLRRAKRDVLQLRVALAREPGSVETRVRLAKAWIALGAFHRALVALEAHANGSDVPAARDAAFAARAGNEADRLRGEAAEALRREDRATALALLQQAEQKFVAAGSEPDLLRCRLDIAIAIENLGRHEEAIEAAGAVERAARAYGDDDVARRAAATRAGAQASIGAFEPYRTVLATVADAGRALDDFSLLTTALVTQAWLLSEEGRLREAFALCDEAIRAAAMTGRGAAQRWTAASIADLFFSAGRLADAERLASEALASSRAARDTAHERYALALLGAVAMRRGDVPTAMKLFEDYYELARRAGSTDNRATARRMQANTLLKVAHDPAGALPRMQQAYDLYVSLGDRVRIADMTFLLGEAKVELGELAAGLELLTRARDGYRSLQRTMSEALVEVEIAHAQLAAGRVPEALAAATAATTLAVRGEDLALSWQAWHALGRVHDRAGRLDEAVKAFARAADALAEDMARGSNDADREGWLGYGRARDVFRDAVDALIRAGQVERAMDVAQRSRDAALRAKLDPGQVKAKDPELQQKLSDVSDATARAEAAKQRYAEEKAKPAGEQNAERLQQLSAIAARTDGELRQLLAVLKRDHRRLYAMMAFSPDSVGELRASLPADVLVVQYFVTDDATYLFTLRKDRAKTRALKVAVKGDELRDVVYEYVSALKTEMPRAPALGAKLYDWLIAPAADEMAQARTTLLVPFGCLHYLPFQALGTVDAGGTPHYALERFRIGYLSSTTLYRLTQQREDAAETLLAFANPDGSLPGARSEVETLVRSGYPQAKVLFEKDAVKQRFFELAGGYRILHFATHGYITTDPTSSFLKMADGELTVNEILGFEGLEGKTDLVVLSACQTALEKGQATEDEPISIASAFATAGAPSLVASLWSVDDEATKELMSRFYDGLHRRGPGFDTLDALREAQLGVLRKELNGGRPFEAPRYWAPFLLVGDFR